MLNPVCFGRKQKVHARHLRPSAPKSTKLISLKVALRTASTGPKNSQPLTMTFWFSLTNSNSSTHRVLKALNQRFGDQRVQIDSTVAPAKQLVRLPGTLTCKGAATPDRPHRSSSVLKIPPDGLKIVPRQLLEKAAADVPAARAPISSFPVAVSEKGESSGRILPEIIEDVRKYLDKMDGVTFGEASKRRRSSFVSSNR
jgi:hypothetical protein